MQASRGRGRRDRSAGGWRTATVRVRRAESERTEPLTEIQSEGDLGHEWEWEDTPEVSLKIVDDLDHAVTLFNRHSPRFAASLISRDPEAHRRFYDTVNAPLSATGSPVGRRAICP